MSIQDIRIIEYDHAYAAAVAAMWNTSADAWGGQSQERTAESVKLEHESPSYLNVYLAVCGAQVIGYCSLDTNKDDPGSNSLFIPALNVDPDYHGQGIGKRLILQALAQTIELGYSRLDLFTWAGNLKAVPLYKKCGFFWEKIDYGPHLMNFIPTVLGTEALKEHFKWFDWYKDSIRTLEVTPDGSQEDDYHYLTYVWEKDGRRLCVEFDRTSRGIRLIETDDYIVKATPSRHRLVFGSEYTVAYEITNKTGQPLTVRIAGEVDKNIGNEIDVELEVADTRTVTSTCYVSRPLAKRPRFGTMPAAVARILINGQEATFRVGIEAIPAAETSLVLPTKHNAIPGRHPIHLNVTSRLDEPAEFTFNLPDLPQAKFHPPQAALCLEAGEKGSVQLELEMRESFAYYGRMDARARPTGEHEQTIEFSCDIALQGHGYHGRMGGATEDGWVIANGRYTVIYDRQNGSARLKGPDDGPYLSMSTRPLLGKPFAELSEEVTPSAEWYPEGDAMVLEVAYELTKPASLELIDKVKLYADGLMSQHFWLKNTGDKTVKCLSLRQGYYHDGSVLPYGNGQLHYNNHGFEPFASQRVSENWVFFQQDKFTRGIAWHPRHELSLMGWTLFLDSDIGDLPPGACHTTAPAYLSIGFSLEQWRAFALQKPMGVMPRAYDSLELLVNGGNPFTPRGEALQAMVKQHLNLPLVGHLRVEAAHGSFTPQQVELADDAERIFEAPFNLKPHRDRYRAWDRAILTADLRDSQLRREALILYTTDDDFTETTTEETAHTVYCVDNSVMQIKAAPSFGNTLFSLRYLDREWLSSSFPQAGPRAWWNPWTGGLRSNLPQFGDQAQLQEHKRVAHFSRQVDKLGNTWRGLCLELTVEDKEKYKGIVMRQNYLMLPGLPLLCYYVELEQNTGHYVHDLMLTTFAFFNLGQEQRETWFELVDVTGDTIRYKGGFYHMREFSAPVLFGGSGLPTSLLAFSCPHASEASAQADNELTYGSTVQRLSGASGSTVRSAPLFLLFSDELMNGRLLSQGAVSLTSGGIFCPEN